MTRTGTLAVAAALLTTVAGVAPASAETTEECYRSTFEVAKGAQTKSPSEEQLKAIEASLTKIENLCDDKKFAEADTERKSLAELVAAL
ncbi:MAG: hypothetical protein AAGG99_01295 [Pseudomonadota bacterium]